MKGLERASRVGTAAVAALCAAAGACSSNGSGTLELTTGGETDTFTQAPVPVTLQVDFIDSAGNTQTLANKMLPQTSIDLGSLDESEDGILTVSALDANRTVVVSGRTVPIDLSTLDGQTASIFVQRTGELARLPEPLPAVSNPVVGVLADRYVVLAGALRDGHGGIGREVSVLGALGSFDRPANAIESRGADLAPSLERREGRRDGATHRH